MNPEQIRELLLKMNHDLAGQRRCLDLVKLLLNEGPSNIEDAKKLLTETIVQFESTQEFISKVHLESLREIKAEIGISLT